MSTPSQIIAPLLNTNGASGPAVSGEKRRRRSRPYKARVSTKIRWAMGDLMERTQSAQPTMARVLEWAEQTRTLEEAVGDTARLARLGKLDHELAKLALDVMAMVSIVTQALAESEQDGTP